MINFYKFFLILIYYFYAASAVAKSDLSYQASILSKSKNPATIHTVEIDPAKFNITIAQATTVRDNSIESVETIAKHHNALAAINGGFFRETSNGSYRPAGILKINNHLYSKSYKTRAAIAWDNNSDLVLVDRIASVNNNITPLLDPDSKNLWKNASFIIGGAPLLIKNHTKITDFHKEQLAKNFLYHNHARTAICILPNKHWKFIIIEENILQQTGGVTIPELADLLHQQNCQDAINLDGGSSSAMYVRDEQISILSRPVTEAILVLEK